MELKIQNKQNFGWFYRTHKGIVLKALDVSDLDSLHGHQARLSEFSKMPDVDERGNFNWHLYNPSSNRSFLDPEGLDNARARYREHVGKVFYAIDEGNTDVWVEHAGRASHFLQDMTQRQHTGNAEVKPVMSLWREILTLREHRAFEGYARKHQWRYFDSYKPREVKDTSFGDLFLRNARESFNLTLPTMKNQGQWDAIAEEGIHRAIDATRALFMRVNDLLTSKRDNEKLEVPPAFQFMEVA